MAKQRIKKGGRRRFTGLLLGVAMGLLPLCALAATTPTSSSILERSVTLQFNTDDVTLTNAGNFQRVALAAANFSMSHPGDPELPSFTTRILVPSDADVIDVAYQAHTTRIATDCVVWPAQRPVPTSDAQPPFTPPDAARYASNTLFPASPIHWNGRTRRIREQQLVALDITPVRYRPAVRDLTLCTSLTITVRYHQPAISALAAATPPPPAFRGHLESLLANPDDLAHTSPVSVQTASDNNPCEYLVITSAALKPAFTALTTHREAFNNFRCNIETVESINARFDGTRPDGNRDLQTQIRNCIRHYVNTRGTVYVVLGGDNTVVPDRNCYIAAGAFIEHEMPTDAYYAGLDGTWDDADADGVYGEHNVGGTHESDLDADVFVGRIPVQTAAAAKAYIAKVIAYETQPPTDIIRKFMMGGKQLWAGYSADQRPDDTLHDGHLDFRDARHPHVSDAEYILRLSFRDHVQAYGWNASQVGCMFDTLTSWDDNNEAGSYPANAANMQSRFSEGWNFLFHDTHGHTGIWNGEASSLGCAHAEALTGLTVFVYTIACQSGAFDREPSLGEAFLRNGQGGALAYLGCSRYGWSGISPAFRDAFLDTLFRDRVTTLGPAFYRHKAQSDSDYAYRRWILYGLNLQGDPALHIHGLETDVTLTSTDAWAAEPGHDAATCVLTRTTADNPLTLNLDLGGTATAKDYTITPASVLHGSITFPAGESRLTIALTPRDDRELEGTETCTIRLIPSAEFAISGSGNVSLALVDNDGNNAARIAANVVDSDAAETNSNPGVFEITRIGGALAPLTVYYSIDGSASASDYQERFMGRLFFSQGNVSQRLTITPRDDTTPEGGETVTLKLLNSPGYTIGSAQATLTIIDNETRPEVSVVATDPDATEGDANDTGLFTITRTGNAGTALTVEYTLDRTGTASEQDFNAGHFNGSVTIPANATSVTLPVIASDDDRQEATETVQLNLTGTDGYAAIGSSASAVVRILDDDNRPPSVTVGFDTPHTVTCGDQVTVTAYPRDPEDAIVWVELLRDGEVIFSSETPPYQTTFTAPTAGAYTFTARVRDSGSATATASSITLTTTPVPDGPGQGIAYRWWTDISGNNIRDLTQQATYPDSPAGETILCQAAAIPANNANNVGSRLAGYFVAPKTGTYRFSIVADDRGELWLGTNGNRDSLRRIAFVNNPTRQTEWQRYDSQISDSVSLTAGQVYCLEALHKNGFGNNGLLAIGVELPGGQIERPIPAHRLMPWQPDAPPIALTTPPTLTIAENGQPLTYALALSSAPRNPVRVSLNSAAAQATPFPDTLHFTADNWWIPQTMTLTAVDDDICEADPHPAAIQHTAHSADDAINGVTRTLALDIRDNDFNLLKWPYKARFCFNGYTGNTTLTNFPALIALSTNIPAFDYAQFTSPNGSDLRFVTPKGHALSYEIETWNPNGLSHVWLRLPELSGSNTVVWAYWGNPVRTNLPAASLDGSLWSADFEAVWHLADSSGTDAAAPYNTLTLHASRRLSAGNMLTLNGTDHATGGIAGAAAIFDGEDNARTANPFDWDGNSFTLSAWAHPATASRRDPQSIIAYGSPRNGTRFQLAFTDPNTVTFGFPQYGMQTATIPNDGWHHWSVIFDHQAQTTTIFRDGVQVATAATAATNLPLTEATLRLGEDFGDARFAGTLDEVRFARTTRSANWIRATYTAAVHPEQFYTCSAVDSAYPVLHDTTTTTEIQPLSATIHGTLLSTGGAPTQVSLFTGRTDGGTDATTWENRIDLGRQHEGPIRTPLTNLTFGTQYHYRFYATNAIGDTWGRASETVVTKMAPPRCAVLAAADIRATTCTLQGFVEYLGLGEDLPVLTLYWGRTDGGANIAQWAHSHTFDPMGIRRFETPVENLQPGAVYYVRAHITSSSGRSWSPATRRFQTHTQAPDICDKGLVTATEDTLTLAATIPNSGGDAPVVTLFWGCRDGGTNPRRWEHAVSVGEQQRGTRIIAQATGLKRDTAYVYRWRATNSGGDDWSATTTAVTRFDRSRMSGRMRITFPGYTRTATLTNFPVALRLNETIPNFSYETFASPDGHDIRFLGANGTLPLPYEIEAWNTNGTSTLWVKLPTLTGNTTIDMYWGDSLQATQHPFTTNGAVWNDNYHGVWHLDNNAVRHRIMDSSPYARHADNNHAATTAGQIAQAESFTNIAEHAIRLDATPCNTLLATPNTPITASCWFRARRIGSGTMSDTLIHLSGPGGWNPILLSLGNGNQLQCFHSGRNAGGDIGFMFSDTTVEAQRWNHAAIVFDGTHFRIYLNGEQVAAESGTLDAGSAASAWIGSLGGSSSHFDGVIDELRFSSVPRSAAWIWTAAISQNPDIQFAQYSPVELSAPPNDINTDHIAQSEPPDADGDGMPDAWEQQHGLVHINSSDALHDSDGDGLSNRQEYIAGTDPTRRGSTLKLRGSASRNGHNLQFQSVSGRHYRIEACATLNANTWTPIANNIPGTGDTITIHDNTPASCRFYRIHVIRN